MTTIHPVILSGGSGTRLWPLSRELYPKQLLPLVGERTMLQETAARLTGLAKEVLFNPKTTTWQLSYDGRAREPVTLPAKFPIVLLEGAEGITLKDRLPRQALIRSAKKPLSFRPAHPD